MYTQKMGLIEDVIEIGGNVVSFFKDLIDKLNLGDQVPDFPIKSKNTLMKITTQIQQEFPAPSNVAQATADLARAKQAAEIAYSKGGDVNNTYGMIYDKVAQTLLNFISYNGNPNGGSGGTTWETSKAGRLCPDGKNYTDENGMCPSGPATKTMGFGTIALLVLGGILLTGGLKPKRRR